MNDVLKIFLSMSLSGSLLIIIFFAGKHFLKNRVSRQWQYYIWLIVIARLLLPFAPETNLMGSLFQTIDHTIVQSDLVQPSKQNQADFANIPDTPPVDGEQGNVKQTETPPIYQPVNEMITLLVHNIWLVWLTVALILLIQKVTVYKGFVRYVEAGQIPISDTELLDRLAVIGEQSGVKKPVELCVNPLMSSPLLIGFFNPCIVLPSTDISEKDFRYIVQHELTHYRRRDMFYKWLVQVTVCLHWFNPLVYLMSREINKACEFSCDEVIISKSDFSSAQEYAKALLDAMATVGKYRETLASVTLNESKKLLKERLGAIMIYKKKSKYIAAVTAILTIVVTFSSLVIGAYAANAATPSSPEKQTIGNQNVSAKSGMALVDSFGKYGFTYNSKENAVYYNGQRVRQFVDGGAYFYGGGYWCDFYYDDEAKQGALYLHVSRNGHGNIQNIEVMSNDMLVKLFGQDNVLNMKPSQNTDTEEAYKDFSQYGLVYDKANNSVIYNGKQVKAFVDGGSKYSNGGYWFNVTFFNDDISSSVYLTSIRDTSGAIIGIEEMSQQMINNYYGTDGILEVSESNNAPVVPANDVQSIFTTFALPLLPENATEPGNFYFYDKQDSGTLAVTRWKNATGTFSLCDIPNTVSDSTISIAYEITVYKGNFNFVHSASEETNVVISESINSNENAAYDRGVFSLEIPEGNNNLTFKCNNADVDIRIVVIN